MTVQELQDQIKQLDDAEFQELLSWVVTPERERRAAQPVIEQAKQEAESETATKIAQQLADEHPELVEKPTETADGEVRDWEPWHPLKPSTHYRYGDKTRHNGKVWRDVLDPTSDKLNVWEPGSDGIDERYWVEENEPDTPTDEDEAEETVDPFVQPTSETPYSAGDKVLFQGSIWQSTIDGNVWSPSDYPQGWKKL
ncbi:hypothetical protein COM45_04990 [Corynebacterium accolens]|uniref:Chitin-binding type-3 domain-containing protein n=1 Tax=Corynebacterium accolens TaxID=38284 RepID=A0A2A4AHA7_9CORY|nr:hypothetical protein COM45_04990 [Corynebacterium accolens]